MASVWQAGEDVVCVAIHVPDWLGLTAQVYPETAGVHTPAAKVHSPAACAEMLSVRANVAKERLLFQERADIGKKFLGAEGTDQAGIIDKHGGRGCQSQAKRFV